MRRFLLVVNKGPEPACTVQPMLEPEREWDYHEILWHRDSKPHPFADRHVRSAWIDPEWRKFEAFKQTSPGDLRDYDAVCLADDDVEPYLCNWGEMFENFMCVGSRVGTPALTPESFCAHGIMKQQDCAWRETNYLDIMCMLFSREGIRDHWDTFSAPREPWGIESIWAQRELAAGRAIAILDSTPVRHVRPINSNPERVAQAMADHDALLKRFGVERITEHKTLKVHT